MNKERQDHWHLLSLQLLPEAIPKEITISADIEVRELKVE
jgi:hypothetical protein